MKLRINGEDHETEKETLSSLLEELKVIPERVAVEVNLKVIRRADYPKLTLKEGDVIEIVNFVGGGQDRMPLKPCLLWSALATSGLTG